MTSRPCQHSHEHADGEGHDHDHEQDHDDAEKSRPSDERADKILRLFKSQFGDDNVEDGIPKSLTIKVDAHTAKIDLTDLSVACEFRPLKDRVQGVLRLIVDSLSEFAGSR